MVAAVVVLTAGLPGGPFHTAEANTVYGTLIIDPDNTDNAQTIDSIDLTKVDVCRHVALDETFDIYILVDDAVDMAGVVYTLNFEGDTPGPAVLEVTGYDFDNWKLGVAGAFLDWTDATSTDGTHYNLYTANIDHVDGDGVIEKITMHALANGTSDLVFTYVEGPGGEPSIGDPGAVPHYPPDEVLMHDPLGDVRIAVGTATCPTPEPSPSPTATPTATPTPSATRTLQWGPGWHNATWSGSSTPEEAFACAAGSYAAAYRLVSGGWERHFPNRPDISNMTNLEQYDAFLILITEEVTCQMPAADPPGTDRTLAWGVGWQNDGWTGADGSEPEDAFECAEGSYAAAYRLVSGGWERYFPDRPEISNMGPLNRYDAFLILATAPVSCTMPIAP